MGTLSDALAPHAARVANPPGVYVDTKMPAGLVSFMRTNLKWDVLFVIEHDDLRRAREDEQYVMGRQRRRTLITLDRDYLDDRKFPPAQSGGVLVLTAPDHRGYAGLLARLDREVFRISPGPELSALPLVGRKLHLHVDWPGDDTISP